MLKHTKIAITAFEMCVQRAGQVLENTKSFKLGISRLVIKTHSSFIRPVCMLPMS